MDTYRVITSAIKPDRQTGTPARTVRHVHIGGGVCVRIPDGKDPAQVVRNRLSRLA